MRRKMVNNNRIGELRFNNHIIAYGKRKDWDSTLWNKGQQQRYPNRGDNFNGGYVVWNTGLHYKIDVNKTKKQAVSFDLTVNNLLNET